MKANNMSKINNMNSLESEIRYLKNKTRDLEKRLDHNVTDLRQNFTGMAMNSVFGTMKDQSVVSVLAERVLYGSKLQDGVVGALDKLSTLLGRIFGRKGDREMKKLEDTRK
jgi:hypothetical protein